GAWGGAHGFRHLRRLLRSERRDVSTPSLTGVGERIHLSSPLVGLGTHIRDVVNHVLYEDLDEIVLVGFSYGGFVVTGALEHIAERVSHLVYLDAFVPGNGETVRRMLGERLVPRLNSVRIGWSQVLCVNTTVQRKRSGWRRDGQRIRWDVSLSRFSFHIRWSHFRSPEPTLRRRRLLKTISAIRHSGGLPDTR